MKEAISALISEKVEAERCIYELKALEGPRTADDADGLRGALGQLAARVDALAGQLRGAKERVDDLSVSAAADSGSVQALEKLHRGLGALEASLRRQSEQVGGRLRARIQRRSLWAGLGDGDADAGQLEQLRREEALIAEGNSRADRILISGSEILSSLDRQRGSLRRVFGELRHIGAELRASEWTATAVRKRLQGDGKLVLLLAVVALVVVFAVYCLARR